MVTGDHPLTAEAISRKVNIITGKTVREVAAGECDAGCVCAAGCG
jgi:magnesium-transporting ATPase (P-type)